MKFIGTCTSSFSAWHHDTWRIVAWTLHLLNVVLTCMLKFLLCSGERQLKLWLVNVLHANDIHPYAWHFVLKVLNWFWEQYAITPIYELSWAIAHTCCCRNIYDCLWVQTCRLFTIRDNDNIAYDSLLSLSISPGICIQICSRADSLRCGCLKYSMLSKSQKGPIQHSALCV